MSFSNSQQSDLLYFDLLITNVDTIYKAPKPVYFNETRTTPYLYEPEQYEMSVVRFNLDTQTLPVIIPPIIPAGALNNGYPETSSPNGDPNKTLYAVSMSYQDSSGNNFIAEKYIEYSPQDLSVNPPPPLIPNQAQDNSNGYYNIYSFQYFISLINKTLNLCYGVLSRDVSIAGGTLPSNYAPVMLWDTDTEKATIYADVLGYSPFLLSSINLYFNPALAQIFSTFSFQITSTASIAQIDSFKAYQVLFTNVAQESELNTVPYPLGSVGTDESPVLFQALQAKQELSTINNMNPIISIVFTTNTIPIIATQVTTPLLYVDGQIQLSSTGNNNNISNVLTDFSADSPLRPYIYYVPTAEFRMISLVGNRPLNNIDVGVFYKTRTGDLVPFRLGSGGSASLKLLFRRKGTT
jgi:hypothetical protein